MSLTTYKSRVPVSSITPLANYASALQTSLKAIADELESIGVSLTGKASTSHTHAQSDVTGLATALASKLSASSNLSDLANASTARTNLGLGTAATVNATSFATASHSHAQSDITGLSTALSGKANNSHTHSATDITSGTLSNARTTATTADTASTIVLRGAGGEIYATGASFSSSISTAGGIYATTAEISGATYTDALNVNGSLYCASQITAQYGIVAGDPFAYTYPYIAQGGSTLVQSLAVTTTSSNPSITLSGFATDFGTGDYIGVSLQAMNQYSSWSGNGACIEMHVDNAPFEIYAGGHVLRMASGEDVTIDGSAIGGGGGGGGSGLSYGENSINLANPAGFPGMDFSMSDGSSTATLRVGMYSAAGSNDCFFQGLPPSSSGYTFFEDWQGAGLILGTGSSTTAVQFRPGRVNKGKITSSGWEIYAPTSAYTPTDNSRVSISLNESTNKFVIKAKYSNGTVKTGEVTLT